MKKLLIILTCLSSTLLSDSLSLDSMKELGNLTFDSVDEPKKVLTDKEEIELLRGELKSLKKEVKKIKKNLSTVTTHENQLRRDFYSHLGDLYIKKIGTFNAKNLGGYQNIETNCGIFHISIKEVKPYLEGHKIIFSIGNPHYAKYEKYKIKITWLNNIEKEVNQEFSLIKALLPGSWNDVECFINPSTLEELKYLELSLDILGTSLSGK